MSWSTPDLCDEYGDVVAVVPGQYQNFGGAESCCGEIVTVRCFEDNSRVKEQLAEPGDGRVLVVDGGASLRCALIGDLIAAGAVDKGWSGVVIRGACRDVPVLRTLDLAVYTLGSCPRRSTRKGAGELNVPIDLDGVLIKPGQWLFADATGLVVADRDLR